MNVKAALILAAGAIIATGIYVWFSPLQVCIRDRAARGSNSPVHGCMMAIYRD